MPLFSNVRRSYSYTRLVYGYEPIVRFLCWRKLGISSQGDSDWLILKRCNMLICGLGNIEGANIGQVRLPRVAIFVIYCRGGIYCLSEELVLWNHYLEVIRITLHTHTIYTLIYYIFYTTVHNPYIGECIK